MKQATKNSIPGCICVYNKKTKPKLRVKSKDGKFINTGLDDTPANRKLCEEIKMKMYLKAMGLDTPEPTAMYIKSAFEKYKQNYLINKSRRTYIGYEQSFNKIATKNVILSKDNVDELINDFIKQSRNKISNTSINLHIRQFRAFINYCIENDMMTIMRFKRYKQQEKRKEIRIYTDDEVKLLLNYYQKADSEFARLIDFIVNTGGRITEVLNLTWQDIQGQEIIFSNKILKTYETVPISNHVMTILDQQRSPRATIWRWKDSSQSALNRKLSAGMKQLNIVKNGRAFHEFRKTFLYRLFRAGTPIEVAYKLMRHKSIRVTMDYYAYFDKSKLQQYVNSIECK